VAVVVLGKPVFAGMSGGIAYIFDVKTIENGLCNMEMVALEELEEDLKKLRRLIKITLCILTVHWQEES
jgi:glutamate synthase (ferredoxin)